MKADLRKMVRGAAMMIGVSVSSLALTSCGSQVLEGSSSSYLIVESMTAASGATPDEFGTSLQSDVVTVVKQEDAAGETVLVPTVFNDVGKVALRLALKDPGSPTAPSKPTENNSITLDRYRVVFIRADGRNTPGVDVPYPFDGSMTVTVAAEAEAGFELVRHTSKLEAPLLALRTGSFINAIAEVTFYGHDQTGRAVSLTARMSVIFGNFGDPA